MRKLSNVLLLGLTLPLLVACSSLQPKNGPLKSKSLIVPKVKNDHPNQRIIGGADAANGQFPYMVSLRNDDMKHFCGGSIIGTEWILTSARCLYQRIVREVAVVVGTNTLEESNGTTYYPAFFIIHERFRPESNLHDIAVIGFNDSIVFDGNVNRISLNLLLLFPPEVTLTGWGSTNFNQTDDTSSFYKIHSSLNQIKNSLCYCKVCLLVILTKN